MPMPVLEETKIGSPQVKTTVPGTPTTPLKAEVIVKKDLNSTPKMSTTVASSSQSVSMEKNASNNASRPEVKGNISAPSSTNNNQNQNQNRNIGNNNSNKPVNGGTNQNQPKNNNNNNNNNNRQNNFNNNQKNNYNNKSQYGNNGMNNGNSFNSVKNEPMKSAPKSFSNQNGNGSNSNSNNNSSNNTTSSSNSNSNEMSSRHENKEKFNLQQSLSQQSQQQSSSVSEKKFTGRCRLFVGNLPLDITEQEFKEIFSKYGEIGEVFLNAQRSFGFIKLDTRINAEHAKQDLDGFTFKGRCIRVRFASHGAAVRVKNLSPCVSNEYLEQAFSIFGTVERAVVIVDDKGRSTGEGIVEFERKPASVQCINKCTDMCFLLTSYPKPVVVEPLEQKDEEDGLPEKSIVRNNQYFIERETPAHFAAANSFEQKLSLKWRELYELEKQVIDEGKKRIDQAREMLEYEIEQALIDHKTMKLKEDLRAKQEELQRIEEMRKSEFQRRQDMENRRIEEERRRQDEMAMMRKQQENMNNPRNMNQNNVSMQSQFDQSHQAVLAQSGSSSQSQQSSSNNRRGGGSNNNPNNSAQQQQHQQQQIANQLGLVNAAGQGLFDQNSLQFQHTNQALQQLPPAQQQALLAAQLCAMAAAAQQGGLGGMFDSPQINLNHNHINNNHGHNNHGNNKSGGGNKDDHRGSNNNSRRQFERRGGSRGGGRDDSYPGYDNKRARF